MTKPGEDLSRVDVLPNVPSGYVRVRRSLPYEEAFVAHGLLASSDIPAALVMPSQGAAPYTRQVPMHLSLAVPEDRAEEADALLGQHVVDDAGDAGAE
jgi:fermentation-respiration switch protein FrsA (DUF1100 family)